MKNDILAKEKKIAQLLIACIFTVMFLSWATPAPMTAVEKMAYQQVIADLQNSSQGTLVEMKSGSLQIVGWADKSGDRILVKYNDCLFDAVPIPFLAHNVRRVIKEGDGEYCQVLKKFARI